MKFATFSLYFNCLVPRNNELATSHGSGSSSSEEELNNGSILPLKVGVHSVHSNHAI